MVKVSFNSALGRKDVIKEAEIILPQDEKAAVVLVQDVEVAVPVAHWSRAWCWCMCLGLVLMLSGVVIGVVYLYHYSVPEEGEVFFFGLQHSDEDYMVPDIHEVGQQHRLQTRSTHRRLVEDEHPEQERTQILEKQQVELINIPVPRFKARHPGNIVHDFQRNLTAYHDLHLDKCYIILLNTSVVKPPRDLQDMMAKIKAGAYKSYLEHEDLVVTERLRQVDQLGPHIRNLCRGKETFRLQRRDHIPSTLSPERHSPTPEPHTPHPSTPLHTLQYTHFTTHTPLHTLPTPGPWETPPQRPFPPKLTGPGTASSTKGPHPEETTGAKIIIGST